MALNATNPFSHIAPCKVHKRSDPELDPQTLTTGSTLSVMANPGSAVTMQFSSVALPLQSWTGGIESSMSKKRNASKRHTRIQPHTHVQHSSTMQYSTTFKWKCKYKQKYQCKYQYQYQHPYNAISARYRAARYFAAQQGFKHYSTAQHSAVTVQGNAIQCKRNAIHCCTIM